MTIKQLKNIVDEQVEVGRGDFDVLTSREISDSDIGRYMQNTHIQAAFTCPNEKTMYLLEKE